MTLSYTKPHVFVINGLPKSGKTLLGLIAKAVLETLQVPLIHLSSITLVKDLLLRPELHDENITPSEVYGWLRKIKMRIVPQDWDGNEKTPFWRGKMSELKLAINEEHPTFINAWLARSIKELDVPSVVFVDIREPENIESFKNFLTGLLNIELKTVFIESDEGEQVENYSDSSVRNMNYDIYIQ